MNKTELITAIAESADISKKDSEKALKAFVDVVTEELKKGEKVQLVGFGTFEVSERAAREGRNPQTGKTMKIEACKAPKFKAGKALERADKKALTGIIVSALLLLFLLKTEAGPDIIEGEKNAA